jgi:predicted permease
MRLAKMKFGSIFTNKRIYVTVALKQFLMPLLGFLFVYFLPIAPDLKRVFFILCACPVASIVLNFAEIVGEGQNEAANSVLLSTLLSIITLPVMMLLLPLI